MNPAPGSGPRIGVLGGAFDPPHVAHVALARAACAELRLDRVLVIPTGQAWHKTRALTPAHHRLAMCQLAFADLPLAQVDAREIQRSGPSYTVDTLRELHAEHADAQFFLVMGADQAQALTQWHEWAALPKLAIICVADRANATGPAPGFAPDIAASVAIRRIPMPALDVSATQIRAQWTAQQTGAPLVFDSVARYIALHHLYQAA